MRKTSQTNTQLTLVHVPEEPQLLTRSYVRLVRDRDVPFVSEKGIVGTHRLGVAEEPALAHLKFGLSRQSRGQIIRGTILGRNG